MPGNGLIKVKEATIFFESKLVLLKRRRFHWTKRTFL